MRSRDPPRRGPAACGTSSPSTRALIWCRAAADVPHQGRSGVAWRLVLVATLLEGGGEGVLAQSGDRGRSGPDHILLLVRRDLDARLGPQAIGLPQQARRPLR